MRTITKFWAAAFLCVCSLQSLSAKDWYVSKTGDDSKNGETPETAVAYLSKLSELGIANGDKVYISGIIDMTADPRTNDNVAGYIQQKTSGAWIERGGFLLRRMAGPGWDKITFIGTDPYSDGFTGKDKARLFRIDGASATFKNLAFYNGRDLNNDGGNGLWLRGTATDFVTFENCTFIGNDSERDPINPANAIKTNGRGGAIFKGEASSLNIYNCSFEGNAAKQGSGVCLTGGKANIVGCNFADNNADMPIGGSMGGGVLVWSLTDAPIELNVDHCLFSGNKVASFGGAIAINDIRASLSHSHVVIKNSTFKGNEAASQGGGLAINNLKGADRSIPNETTVINSTFWGNKAKNDGGGILLWNSTPNSKFTMVNCTVSGNISEGNGGHGPGLAIVNSAANPSSNTIKRFYNCIFDDNYAIDADKLTPSDFTVRTDVVTGEIEVHNSFAGRISNTATTPESIWFNSDKGYITASKCSERDPDIENHAGIVTGNESEFFMKSDGGTVDFLPLLNEYSPAFFYGKAQWLNDFGITTDQLGNTRKILAKDCAVGAVEATVKQAESGDFIFIPILTGIKESVAGDKAEIKLINGVITVNTQEKAKLTLYNFNGGVEKQADNQISTNGLNGGFYIVKAVVNNQILVQKIKIR